MDGWLHGRVVRAAGLFSRRGKLIEREGERVAKRPNKPSKRPGDGLPSSPKSVGMAFFVLRTTQPSLRTNHRTDRLIEEEQEGDSIGTIDREMDQISGGERGR